MKLETNLDDRSMISFSNFVFIASFFGFSFDFGDIGVDALFALPPPVGGVPDFLNFRFPAIVFDQFPKRDTLVVCDWMESFIVKILAMNGIGFPRKRLIIHFYWNMVDHNSCIGIQKVFNHFCWNVEDGRLHSSETFKNDANGRWNPIEYQTPSASVSN